MYPLSCRVENSSKVLLATPPFAIRGDFVFSIGETSKDVLAKKTIRPLGRGSDSSNFSGGSPRCRLGSQCQGAGKMGGGGWNSRYAELES